MAANFMYFESQDGGMGTISVKSPEDLKGLYGWMSHSCALEDTELVRWMTHAEVGELRDHRLGALVRLKD